MSIRAKWLALSSVSISVLISFLMQTSIFMQDEPLGLNPRSNKNTYIKLRCYLVQTLVGFSKCTGCQSELSGWLCQVSPSRDGCLCCATQLFRKIYYVNNNSFTHIVPIHIWVEIIFERVFKKCPCGPFRGKLRSCT